MRKHRIWAALLLGSIVPFASASCKSTTGGGAGGSGGAGGASGTGGATATGTGGGGAALKWYATCGDPVCSGHEAQPGVDLCTTEKAGDACTPGGAKCDPSSDCNALLLCTDSDPTLAPGGCPISRARFKRDIKYLDSADVARVHDELVNMKLTTWRYNHDAEGEREHLGFIIDDAPGSAAVADTGNHVDLYGYTSMAVAALQVQEKRIAEMEREMKALREELQAVRAAKR